MGQEVSQEEKVEVRLTDVVLHVYDLGSVHQLNKLLRPVGTGAFHCGVELFGWEWSYAGSSNSSVGPWTTGVFNCRPRLCKGHRYSESVDLGKTSMTPGEVLMIIQHLESTWLASEYSLLWHNCGHFCSHLCRALSVDELPAWVMSLAGAGQVVEKYASSCNPRRLGGCSPSSPISMRTGASGNTRRTIAVGCQGVGNCFQSTESNVDNFDADAGEWDQSMVTESLEANRTLRFL